MEKELTKRVIKVLLKGNSGEHVISFEDKKRLMIGSAEACDVTIVNDTISPIHVVLEYHNGTCTLYDMNSRLGTKVNGQKCIKQHIKIGDSIELGAANFKVAKMGEEVELPPPVMPSLKIKPGRKLPAKAPKKAIVTSEEEVHEYELSYPLSKDPEADFTEYIFEDSDELYPTFKYNVDKSAVEVIVLFQDRIISVDYIADSVKQAYMCGMAKYENDLEYPYLAKKSRDLFLEMSPTECTLHPLYGHSMATVGGEKEVDSAAPISLGFDDIIRFTREDIQIFVRRTDAPPEVATAPVFKDDPEFRKYLAIMLILISMFLGTTYFFKVDKDVEKEKIPERIATILYKKMPKKIPPKKVHKKVVQNKITQKVKQKTKPQEKPAAQKPVAKKVEKKSPVITRKQVKTAPKIAQTKKPSTHKATSTKNNQSKRVVSKTPIRKATQGRVDVYKSTSFTSSLNSLMAKGGSTGDFQAKVVSASTGEVGVRGESAQGAFKKANVSSSVGDLSNATVGKLDQGSGVEGIVNKKTIGRASIPVETIAVGMDPNLIRQTLMQYLDQFRYCYQNALDASRNSFSGVVLLDFTIAASGRVSRANAQAKKGHLTSQVQSCVVNVLRKIPFPAPPGNEIVDVRQPMNFYPKIK